MLNLYNPDPDHERAKYMLVNGLLLLAALLIAACLNGCHPYEVAKRKYATNVVDTTFVNITTTIPRDSVVLKIKTDTTHLIETVRQGRATVTIIREPKITTVYANCDSASKSQKVLVKTVTQKWGVDPVYKDRAEDWRSRFWVLFGLFGVSVIAYFLVYRIRLYITKRDGTGTTA